MFLLVVRMITSTSQLMFLLVVRMIIEVKYAHGQICSSHHRVMILDLVKCIINTTHVSALYQMVPDHRPEAIMNNSGDP